MHLKFADIALAAGVYQRKIVENVNIRQFKKVPDAATSGT